ncbi:MAG: hypothetical protein R3F28_12395 [Candidatus Kapaibacterium sp.]
MTTRQQYTSTNVLTKEERFGHSSWRNLPWSYEREDPTITVGYDDVRSIVTATTQWESASRSESG